MLHPVIFDLDGVLVDSEPLYQAAFERYVEKAGHPGLRGWFANTLGRRGSDFAPELAPRLGRSPSEVLAGLEAELEGVLEAVELRAMPHAVETVHRLGAGGRALGLASSSARSFIGRVLAGLRLSRAFAASAAGDEAHRGKPDPEIYLTVAERLGRAPSACVAIEDTPIGAAAAAAAGMKVIAVPNSLTAGLELPEAEAVVPDLRRAARLIDELDACARPA